METNSEYEQQQFWLKESGFKVLYEDNGCTIYEGSDCYLTLHITTPSLGILSKLDFKKESLNLEEIIKRYDLTSKEIETLKKYITNGN